MRDEGRKVQNSVRSRRVARVLEKLEPLYQDDPIEVNYETPFQLIVAVILSAQCTDKRVNLVTATFFDRYRDPQDFLTLSQTKLETLIRSTGFFRNKAKNILGAAQMLLDEYDGVVPQTMKELVRLPGFGRKTANVILNELYGIHEGVCVDTHVLRLSRLLELTTNKTAIPVEKDLMAIVPQNKWSAISHCLILHGRRVCFARKPRCDLCPLIDFCPSSSPDS